MSAMVICMMPWLPPCMTKNKKLRLRQFGVCYTQAYGRHLRYRNIDSAF
jgi:hypothetical protein